ncbi:MAG: hypothetical protein AAFR87_02870 [Bacteroidota bacterium]
MFAGIKPCKAQDLSGPRLLRLNYQTLSQPTWVLGDQGQSMAAPDDEPSQSIDFQMRFPMLLGKQTKILGELSYRNEMSSGFYTMDNGEWDGLDQRWGSGLSLQKTGFGLIVLHDMGHLWDFKLQAAFSSSSTRFFSNNPNSHSYKAAAVFEHSTRRRTIGFGLNVNYQFRLAVIPIFTYKEKLNHNWTVDMLLPVKAQLIRNFNNSNRLIMGIRGSAGSYFLDQEQLFTNSLYQRITLHGYLGYERMLSKYIGIGLDAGVNIPIRDRIRSWDNSNIILHDFQSRISPHISARIFFAISSS